MFLDAFRQLDRLLRGEATRLPALRQGTLEIPVLRIVAVGGVLGVAYGLCMGSYAGLQAGTVAHEQFVASAIKVPLLFGLTLVVTFPSLYVFNALVGSRLVLPALLKLLTASLGVTLAVLASLGPIVAFFSLSTTSYPFMVLLNVAVFAVSGLLGLAFLLQTLHRLSVATAPPPSPVGDSPIFEKMEPGPCASPAVMAEMRETHGKRAPAGPTRRAGALDAIEGHVLGAHVKTVFRIWLVVFGLVGAQMSWVLRPFIGDPALPFAWFRDRQGNFFEGVVTSLTHLFR